MEDTKIYLITYMEEGVGGTQRLVSHGVGNNTLKNYVLPQDPIMSFKPKQDVNGFYIDA